MIAGGDEQVGVADRDVERHAAIEALDQSVDQIPRQGEGGDLRGAVDAFTFERPQELLAGAMGVDRETRRRLARFVQLRRVG